MNRTSGCELPNIHACSYQRQYICFLQAREIREEIQEKDFPFINRIYKRQRYNEFIERILDESVPLPSEEPNDVVKDDKLPVEMFPEEAKVRLFKVQS
jgi:hypothetical protein